MASQNVLILGAGELGMAIVRSLSKHRINNPAIRPTVLLRPTTIVSTEPAKSQQIQELLNLDISLLPGDLASSSASELSTLFRPFDTIIGCTGYASGKPIQVKICQAVLNAGVSRYFPWQFGVDYDVIGRGSAQDLFDEQLNVRDTLRGQERTEWVIVSTGMFTSFLFESWFGVVDLQKGVVRAFGGWENKVTVTAAKDIGKLTAEVVFAVLRVRNTVVYTAGDTVTYEELVNVVEEVRGEKMRREVWTVEMLKEELRTDPADAVKKYRVVFGEGKGVSWDISNTFNDQHGILVQDVRSWVKEHVK